jgi:hypothetical protein
MIAPQISDRIGNDVAGKREQHKCREKPQK